MSAPAERDPLWTHKGLFLGFIPVVVAGIDQYDPVIAGRWFWCDWLISLLMPFIELCFTIVGFLNPHFDASFPVRITGQLDFRWWGD